MTDSIIQEVFRKYIESYDSSCSCHVKIEFDRLQQELTDRIRHQIEFGCPHCKGVCKNCVYLSLKITGVYNE